MFCEVERFKILGVSALSEEDQELDLITFEVQAAYRAGDPSPLELKATFMAQVIGALLPKWSL